MQLVELHFHVEPELNYSAIKTRAEELLGETLDASNDNLSRTAFVLYHNQHPLQGKDGVIVPQTALLRGTNEILIDNYTDEIQQSWGFRDCSTVFSTSKFTLLVTELMAQSMKPYDRIRLFHGVLQAVIELTMPVALVFKHSQQVIRAQAYLESVAQAPILRPGSLNARFFNISNSNGDILMDTRGLTEIGLHDLQCHFRDLDPNAVGNVLYNTALYIFQNGPVIESGNTIAGTEEGSKWRCQFEKALIAPSREVLDLSPGPPFAAGNRG